MRLRRGSRRPAGSMRPALGYLVPAQNEARRLGHHYVGTEHILLGLLERPTGPATLALQRLGVTPDAVRDRVLDELCPRVDPNALATLGIDLEQVRARVEESFGPGSLELGPTGCVGVMPRAKLSLQYAVDEARGGPVSDTDVLIGMLSVKDSLAARILAELGVSLTDVQAALQT